MTDTLADKRAWYLGCRADQIAERVILLGDPGRVPRLAGYLDDVEVLPVNRGLATVTGRYKGERVTLAAFGMGAPIAAIVLHELHDIGARVFLRIGTSMCLPPHRLGDLLVAESAVCREGTSGAYLPDQPVARADPALVLAIADSAATAGVDCHVGRFASYDGFYRDMFALDPATADRVERNFRGLAGDGVGAVDMETSAILTVATALGCRAGSLCAASVDGLTRTKLSPDQMQQAESRLITIALDTLVSVSA